MTTTTTLSSRENGDEDVHERGSLSTMRVFLSDRFDVPPPPSTRHLPPGDSSAWVGGTISNFSRLRSYLEAESSRPDDDGGGGGGEGRTRWSRRRQRGDGDAVPRMRDRPGWHVFCLGREQAYGNVHGYHCDNDDDDDDEEKEEKEKEGEDGEEDGMDGGEDAGKGDRPPLLAKRDYVVVEVGRPPTTSLLLRLDQVLVRAVFHHHVHYLVEWRMPLTRHRATWMYALLARMEKPMRREECAGVRGVLRECCRRRRELELPPPPSPNPSSSSSSSPGSPGGGATTMYSEAGRDNDPEGARETLALLNTLIAITGVYFEQGPGGGNGMDMLFSCGN
jgi:survival of motor neuron protein-interacting protein 1